MRSDFVEPELATLVSRAPGGADWIHEIKLDGYRMGALLGDGKVRMLTRTGLDWTARFQPITDTVAKLKARSAYLDGEVVALDHEGVSNFGMLQQALTDGRAEDLAYFAFDLLRLDGRDFMGLPLVERKAELEKLVSRSRVGARVRYSEHIEGSGLAFFREACRAGLEGIVSKRVQSTYRSGRRGDWLKTKCVKRQELVIGGWRPSTASDRELGSLLVGYYSRGRLVYAGRVGTGFTIRLGRELVRLLRRRVRETSPFVEVPRTDAREARWVGPDLVAEIKFTEWTHDGHIRHPSFKGLRHDKRARDVKAERPRRSS